MPGGSQAASQPSQLPIGDIEEVDLRWSLAVGRTAQRYQIRQTTLEGGPPGASPRPPAIAVATSKRIAPTALLALVARRVACVGLIRVTPRHRNPAATRLLFFACDRSGEPPRLAERLFMRQSAAIVRSREDAFRVPAERKGLRCYRRAEFAGSSVCSSCSASSARFVATRRSRRPAQRSVSLTFDDGTADQYQARTMLCARRASRDLLHQ